MPRQNKVILQRQYREKEGESFGALRDVINELTGKELQTRQEILRKAIDLLLAVSEIRKLEEAQAVHPKPDETHPPGPTAEDATLANTGYFAESDYRPENWQSTAEFDSQSVYCVSQSNDQQRYLIFNTESAFNQASSLGHGEDWPNYF